MSPRRAKAWSIRRIIFMITLVFAVAVIGYGIYGWSQFGFTLGPPRGSARPDPSVGFRYFVIAGGVVAAYSMFELYRPVSNADDDETLTI